MQLQVLPQATLSFHLQEMEATARSMESKNEGLQKKLKDFEMASQVCTEH